MPIVPNSPTELKATGRHEEVGLTWDDPDDASIDKYQYQQLQADNAGTFATWGADWTDIPDSNASTTEYIHFGLTNGVNYRFRIRAVDPSGPRNRRRRNSATHLTMPKRYPGHINLEHRPTST